MKKSKKEIEPLYTPVHLKSVKSKLTFLLIKKSREKVSVGTKFKQMFGGK